MNLKKKDISHYLYPCYISLKNKDMFPGKKKVRDLERNPDIYPFCQFHEKCPHFSLFLIRHSINENKTGKANVCKGKLSFLGDIASKLSCLQFFQGRKSTFLELILHSFKVFSHFILK
jgi:hypothetical protein